MRQGWGGGRGAHDRKTLGVGGGYLFLDKYVNHVNANGLTTLRKCTPTSMSLDSHFSALLSVLEVNVQSTPPYTQSSNSP